MAPKRLNRKYYRQSQVADWQKRQLIRELYRLLDQLEGYPALWPKYSPGLYGLMERIIERGLDKLETRFLRPHWKARRKRRRS